MILGEDGVVKWFLEVERVLPGCLEGLLASAKHKKLLIVIDSNI